MAAGTIKVSPEQLQATASEFSSQASVIANTTGEMISLVSSSSSAWTGEAASQFVSRFGQLQDDMTRIAKMVEEYSTDLTDIANVYTTAENENAQMAQALAADVIV